MLGKSPIQNQKNIFAPLLSDFINPEHALCLLADKIQWSELEEEFSSLYSNTGTPSKPVRLMVGLLILKQLYNLGDETLMPEWVRDPYFQYFCGEAVFQWKFPCDPSDLVHFRNRIGKEGVERILKLSVDIQPERDKKSKDVIIDTTAQEKNITFPTDSKLYRKIIERCRIIADEEDIPLRQSYRRIEKKLLFQLRFGHHPKRRHQATKSIKKLRIIAGRLVRELERKMPDFPLEYYQAEFKVLKRILAQRKNTPFKIYSLHEPEVSCIAKGKSHKPYEFGNKVSFAMLPGSNIIVGVANFKGNPHDSKTLEPTLKNAEMITGRTFKNAIVDRGYKGLRHIGDTRVIIPGQGKNLTAGQKRWYKKKCRSRAAIEPVIGHIKHDHRMLKNYLKGTVGDEINSILAAAAFNFRRMLRIMEQNIILLLNKIMIKQVQVGFFYLIPIEF